MRKTVMAAAKKQTDKELLTMLEKDLIIIEVKTFDKSPKVVNLIIKHAKSAKDFTTDTKLAIKKLTNLGFMVYVTDPDGFPPSM